MRGLCTLCRQGLVVVLLGGIGVERQVELVAPAELEARAWINASSRNLRTWMTFGEVSRVGGQFIGDDAGFDVIAIR